MTILFYEFLLLAEIFLIILFLETCVRIKSRHHPFKDIDCCESLNKYSKEIISKLKDQE